MRPHRTKMRFGSPQVALLVAGLAASASASAQSEEPNSADSSAGFRDLRAGWTAGAGGGRAGLSEILVGASDWLDLGIHVLPFFIGAPNGEIRMSLAQTEHGAVRAGVGVFRVDLKRVGALLRQDDWEGQLLSIPISLTAAYETRSGLLSAGLHYTIVTGSGSAGSTSTSSVADVSNLQIEGRWESRIASHAHWWLNAWVVAMSADVVQTSTTIDLGDGSTADVVVVQDTDTTQGTWAATTGFRFVGGSTNLVLGAGYGNFAIPGLNLILDKPGLIPVAELFWRW